MAQIGNQIVSGHKVSSLPGLNGRFRQCHREVSFTHARRPQKNHVGSFMHETQRSQFPNLPFVDGRLEAEIELIERLQIRQMRQLQTRLQIALSASVHLRTHHFQQEVGVGRFVL